MPWTVTDPCFSVLMLVQYITGTCVKYSVDICLATHTAVECTANDHLL